VVGRAGWEGSRGRRRHMDEDRVNEKPACAAPPEGIWASLEGAARRVSGRHSARPTCGAWKRCPEPVDGGTDHYAGVLRALRDTRQDGWLYVEYDQHVRGPLVDLRTSFITGGLRSRNDSGGPDAEGSADSHYVEPIPLSWGKPETQTWTRRLTPSDIRKDSDVGVASGAVSLPAERR
jgi:hypothetical protein